MEGSSTSFAESQPQQTPQEQTPKPQEEQQQQSQPTSLLSQAKGLVLDTVDTVKEKMSNLTPRKLSTATRDYLSDISSRNWKLNHVQTEDKTTLPNMGWNFTKGISGFNLKFTRKPLFRDIREHKYNMNHVEPTNISDRSVPQIPKDYKFATESERQAATDRRQKFLGEIRGFQQDLNHVETTDKSEPQIDPSLRIEVRKPITQLLVDVAKERVFLPTKKLASDRLANGTRKFVMSTTQRATDTVKVIAAEAIHQSGIKSPFDHPQASFKHEQEYLNDIAKGNWKLRHVSNADRCTKFNLKYTRKPLFNEITEMKWKEQLKHIPEDQIKDRSGLIWDKDMKMKFNLGGIAQRKEFLKDIEGVHALKHVDEICDKSAPQIKGMKLNKRFEKPSLYMQAKGMVVGTVHNVVDTVQNVKGNMKDFATETLQAQKDALQKEFVSASM